MNKVSYGTITPSTTCVRFAACSVSKVKLTAIWEFDCQKGALLPMFSVDWLPPTTTVFHLKSCALTQSIKTPRLPRGLVYIFIGDRMQADETPMCVPDMSSLPKTLRQLFMLRCALSGTVNFTDLPAGIQVIQMSQISDILVDMRTLPSSLYVVNLANGSKKVQKHIMGKDKLDERFSRGDAFIGKLKTDIQLQCIRRMRRIESELEGDA